MQQDSHKTQVDKKPVVLINVFTLKEGKLDEFIELQTAALHNFKGKVPGWLGSRLHRELDGSSAVMMSIFESREDINRWYETKLFSEHRAKVIPLVERAEPKLYEVVYKI